MYKKLFAVVLAMVMVSFFTNDYYFVRADDGLVEMEDTVIPISDLKMIFRDEGYAIPTNANFAVSKAELSNGESVDVGVMTVVNGNDIQKSIILAIASDNNEEEIVGISEMISAQKGENVNIVTTKSYSSVSMNAYYNRQTITNGYIYQPYKLSYSTSVQKNVYVEYRIQGFKYTANGTKVGTTPGVHQITHGEYPAYVGYLYETTNTAPYYYYMRSGGPGFTHSLNITVDGIVTTVRVTAI